jgi:MFS transporter, DHA1 family, multidrug resistance protein
MQSTRPAEFITLVALLNAMVAMSIDTMLPAIGMMATELGAANANDRQFIIVGFFAGTLFGNLIFGPVSDSVGRKPMIFAGLALYILGALICMTATSFPVLIAGRLLQGFAAASPRIVSIAMVRDGSAGPEMARTMSFVMSVFMLVPILAPAIGQVVLTFANWRWIFGGFVVAALLAGLWLAFRQEETLAVENRRPFTVTALMGSAKEVVLHPISLGYTIAVGGVFGSFVAYLGTSQQIFADQYGQGKYFAFWFGGLAVSIAIAMIINGRMVMRLGMRALSKWALRGFIVVSTILLLASMVTAGHPPLWSIGVLFFAMFFCSGMLFGNYNAMAMEPMGHIAGMASAVTAALSTLTAVTIGGVAGRYYDGTMLPLAIGFFVCGIVALVFSEWAERGRTAV